MRRTGTTTAVVGTVLVGLLLTGCTAFGGDDDVPEPTRRAAERTPAADPSTGTEQVRTEQALPAGTVVAETDAVSQSGDTAVRVRIVANGRGRFDAQLSDYRTTNPQPMTLEFRRSAEYGDTWDSASMGTITWQADAAVPATVSLAEAGSWPDFLRAVVLVPAASGADDSDRPWVGSVLAVGALSWRLPAPFPDVHVTVGADRPGAYGTVDDRDGVPSRYRVAHGDDHTTVAERFGITVPELQWLNPTMEVRGDGWLYEDTTLNLDPATR